MIDPMIDAPEPRTHPELDAFVGGHAAAGEWPGGVYAAGPAAATPRWLGFAGSLATSPAVEPITAGALYDLASLTKVVATAPIALSLAEQGDLDLEAPLDDLLPELSGYGGRSPTFTDLMAHRAGFPAWIPLARSSRLHADVLAEIARSPSAQVGVALYSDLGPICAGIALQRLTGMDLDQLLERHVIQRMGVAAEDLRFGPISKDQLWRVAPTEFGRAKEQTLIASLGGQLEAVSMKIAEPLRGVAHDGNAAAMGGVAGHAGLFGTAAAVFRVISAFVSDDGPFSEASRLRVRTALAANHDDTRSFGFQLGTARSAPAGRFGHDSFGHVGFTGTSAWVACRSRSAAVLLTNRVHPVWREAPMQQRRREFHDLVAAILRLEPN